MIDSYVARRYRVPMDVPPAIITAKCCDMARFGLSTGDMKTPSEEVRARHRDAMDWLRDVSKGAVVLELDEVSTATDQATAQMSEGRAGMFGGRY
jgi:phage gp36-like protein